MDKTSAQALMFFNRLQKARRHLSKWARKNNVGLYRLYDKDIPEIPLRVDFANAENCGAGEEGGAALCCSLYERPYEKDSLLEENWLAEMSAAAAKACAVPPGRVFTKLRRRQNPENQYAKTETHNGFPLVITERSLKFKLYLNKYIDTGLFPDIRLLREEIKNASAGKNVLNLFSYTGAFSVAAAAGGAARVDSVDISNTYIEWAKENIRLNGLAGASCNFLREDVFRFLKEPVSFRKKYSIIILDPPVFSASKKMNGILDIKKDAPILVSGALKLLKKDGVLYFCTRSRGGTLFLKSSSFEKNFLCEDISEKMRDKDFIKKRLPCIMRVTWRH